MRLNYSRSLLPRILIAVVCFFNVQCALLFIIDPAAYVASFELSGVAGVAMVRAMGILFLMWNVPYFVALLDPVKHRVSLFEAVAMQAIGLCGETILLLALPAGHPALQASALRFILFDGGGLVLLVMALCISRRKQPL